jgi:hypothetical protein
VAAPSKASRAGLAPAQRPTPPPVDPRLRPWYERCKSDHDRLGTIQGQHITTYQAKMQYEESKRVAAALAAQDAVVRQLLAVVAELREIVGAGVWQGPLTLPDLPKLPERAAAIPTRKRGVKPAETA